MIADHGYQVAQELRKLIGREVREQDQPLFREKPRGPTIEQHINKLKHTSEKLHGKEKQDPVQTQQLVIVDTLTNGAKTSNRVGQHGTHRNM